MSSESPTSEVDAQVHDIFALLNDPIAIERRRLEKNKKERAENIVKDTGLT